MADPDIRLAVTADVSQAESAMRQLEETTHGIMPSDGADALGAGIEKLGDACRKAAGSVAALDLDALKAQFSALRGIDNTVGGLSEQLAGFETRLKQLECTLSEGVDGYGDLSSAFYDLLSVYKSGAASAAEVKAAFDDLVQSARAQNDTVKAARREIAGLSGDQSALIDAKRDEVEAYNKTQAAARAELDAFIKAQEEKAARRQLEMQSIEQLEQKLDELDRRADEARSKGDAAAELEAVKAQEFAIAAIERKTAAQEKANERAHAAIEKIEAANRREAASIQELTEELENLKAAQEAASEAGDVQAEAQYAKAAQETVDAIERKQAEADKAAAALEKAAQAAEREAEAAKKEAAALESARRRMNLATKSAKELADEVARLTEAREKAAEAGDEDAYADLTDQLGEAKSAFGELSKEANISKTALLGKAQAGAQAAQQLGSLAQQVRSGNVDLANMSNTIMSVGLAIKAGLGPIGWAMAAVQGLQMAWDYFSNSQKEAKEATENAAKALAELNNELERNAIAVSNAKFGELKANLERETESLNEATQRQLRTHDTAVKADAAKTASLIKQAKCRIDASKAEMQAMVDTGKMSAAEMAAQSEKLDAELAAMQNDANDKAEAAQMKRLEILRDSLNEQRSLTRAALKDFERENGAAFTRFWTDEVDKQANETKAQIESISADIATLEKSKESQIAELVAAKKDGDKLQAQALRLSIKNTEREIEATKRYLKSTAQNFKDMMGDLIDDKDHDLFQLDAVKFVNAALDYRAKGKELEDTAAEIQQSIFENGDAIESAEQAAKNRKDELKAQEESTRIIKESNRVREEALQTQKAIADQITGIGEQYKTHRRYAESSSLTQQQIFDADKAALEAKLADLQAIREKGGLDDTNSKTLDAAIADVESQLRGLSSAVASVELKDLASSYKLIGSYSRKIALTQEQIWRKDQETLYAKRDALQALLAKESLDAQTRDSITNQLQEVDSQLDGMNASMAQAAQEAGRWVRALEPPKLDAARKGTQRHLNNLANAYRRMAQRAAKAAEKGDIKGFDRAQRSMDVYARSMEKLAAKPGDVERYHDEAKRKISAAAGAADTSAKEEKRAAKASKQKADATEKAAKAAGRAVAAADTQTQSIVDLSARVVELQNVIQNITRAVETLNNSITGTTQAAKAAYDCIISCASSTERAVKELRSRCTKAESRIGRLEART